jgi:hypothetical protein
MDNTAHLRRQAALCLSLSHFSLDPLVAEHLSCLAAAFHEGALRGELENELGRREREGGRVILLH